MCSSGKRVGWKIKSKVVFNSVLHFHVSDLMHVNNFESKWLCVYQIYQLTCVSVCRIRSCLCRGCLKSGSREIPAASSTMQDITSANTWSLYTCVRVIPQWHWVQNALNHSRGFFFFFLGFFGFFLTKRKHFHNCLKIFTESVWKTVGMKKRWNRKIKTGCPGM